LKSLPVMHELKPKCVTLFKVKACVHKINVFVRFFINALFSITLIYSLQRI